MWKCGKCGETDASLRSTKSQSERAWCVTCNRKDALSNNKIKARACDILSLPRGVGSAPDGTPSPWMRMDKAIRKWAMDEARKELVEEIPEAKPEPFTHPELDRIIRERKANYSFADKVEATKRDGFVYVIVHPSFPAVCKIGRSRDPNKRLSAANTWCPYSEFELHCAVYSDDAVKLEAEVHEALARRDRNEVGEWFFINKWHAENLIHMVKEGRDNGNTNSRHRSQRIPPCRGHDLAG